MTNQKIVYNPLNVEARPKQRQGNFPKSLTIPDQTMSIKTLVQKFVSGQPIDGAKTEFYEEETHPSAGINPKTLDLVDIQAIARENEARIKELHSKHQEEQRSKQQERHAKYLEEQEMKDWYAKYKAAGKIPEKPVQPGTYIS